MKLSYFPYDLKFKQPFAIAHGTRDHTEAIFVTIEYNNLIGYGETTFPPYLPDNRNSAIQFFEKIIASGFEKINSLENAIGFVQNFSEENFPAKAALDIALCDLLGKQQNKSLHHLWNLDATKIPVASFTIGMGTPKEIIEKVKAASDFKLLKVKLGGPFDKMIIETIHSVTDVPISVDANQGWEDEYFAVDMIAWLAEMNCVFVEQPLPKNDFDKMQFVFERSALPLIADESLQTINDLPHIQNCFHGINVKLMKCGGLSNAKRLIEEAQALNLKILIGCMSESSCGCSAAAQLAPLSNWIDLDGPLLISNDPFYGIKYVDGKMLLNDNPGIGVTSINF